jgi:hypothetical protein
VQDRSPSGSARVVLVHECLDPQDWRDSGRQQVATASLASLDYPADDTENITMAEDRMAPFSLIAWLAVTRGDVKFLPLRGPRQ